AEVRAEAEQRLHRTTTVEEEDSALQELRIWKGQRTAWRFLQRTGSPHSWESFEAFCRDVVDVPVMRYAMVVIDSALPIGPGNFRWAYPLVASRQTTEGIVAHNQARRDNRDHYRAQELSRIYQIDRTEYLHLFNEQQGVCAICGQPETKLANRGSE